MSPVCQKKSQYTYDQHLTLLTFGGLNGYSDEK